MAEPVDLTNCDREPIHLLGKVQEFGFLLGVTYDWMISHVSENVGDWLHGVDISIVGAHASEILTSDAIHTIRNKLQHLGAGLTSESVGNIRFLSGERDFDCTLHISGNTIILEFEPSPERNGEDDIAIVRSAIDRIAGFSDIERICDNGVRFVKALSGFKRVMLYRFLPDDSGEVVAEARTSDLEPFLNLRYPASDIPKQARALYIRSLVRVIADVNKDGVPIRPTRAVDGSLLDLSSSTLRSVSPIHLEYLRNMGVGASMSISLVIDNRLWGLIACHHDEPHVPTLRQRNAMVLYGQMLSLILQAKLGDAERAKDDRVREFTNHISRSFSSEMPSADLLRDASDSFSEILEVDGFAVVMDGEVTCQGTTPTESEILSICRLLNSNSANEIFATNEIAKLTPAAADFAMRAAGVLSIPISRTPRDYILFFRQEVVRKVNWAGNPQKPVTPGPNGIRLTPRKSFEAWQEEQRGQSEEWSASDLRAAAQLRVMLLEVILRLSDEANKERKIANERQELLVAELNHRVRNILGLVRGLISQTNSGDMTTAEYVSMLDHRVHALARAHDQITKENWSPAPLNELIETEAASYLLDKQDRVIITGDRFLLTPQAYSTLALVFHELMTNAAKYGALADTKGTVSINVKGRPDGSMILDWEEKGGPPVKAPTRRGFGSTIVDRSIPFELQGKCEIEYAVSGVRVHIWLPKSHVIPQTVEPRPAPVAAKPAEPFTDDVEAPAKVLVVEDNLLIAMEAEEIFLQLGSTEVSVHSTASAALAEIEAAEKPFDFAMLDINLGSENSIAVAERLHTLGVPFIFASGYGESFKLPEILQAVPRVPKPYSTTSISAALRQEEPAE